MLVCCVFLYLRTPTVAGVQGGCVVLLYTLVHAKVAHLGVTNLCKDTAMFGPGKLTTAATVGCSRAAMIKLRPEGLVWPVEHEDILLVGNSDIVVSIVVASVLTTTYLKQHVFYIFQDIYFFSFEVTH